MNVEIGAEAAQFPEKEYINGIALAVQKVWRPRNYSNNSKNSSTSETATTAPAAPTNLKRYSFCSSTIRPPLATATATPAASKV
jgi:hypothetical protein